MATSKSDYKIHCLSVALSPITHAKGVSGNESLVMREPVVTGRGIQWLPCLSGNAIRHRCVREPGWRWLIELWGLSGKLTLPQLNYAFHGGNLTEGGGRENTRRLADMQRFFPLSRLMGGCLPDQVIPGSLDVWRGRLVCEENRAWLQADLPDECVLPTERFRPGEAFVTGYQYTRGDVRKTAIDVMPDEVPVELQRSENRDGKSNLMLFAGQAVTTGSCFLHGFTLKHCSTLELGALLLSLRWWQAAGGTIGGQAARGHGRLHTSILGESHEDAVVEYFDYCATVRDEAAAWLDEAFAVKVGKKPVAKGGKQGKKDTEPTLLPEETPA